MCKTRAPRGLTLVEILTALFVLAIGLGSVMAIVVRSANMGSYACDRNDAAILLGEAIDDIKHMMLISANDAKLNGFQEGEMMDTVGLGNGSSIYGNVSFNDINFNNTNAGSVPSSSGPFPFKSLAYKNGTATTDLAYWPFSVKYSRTMGMYPTPAVLGGSSGGDSMYNKIGVAYRALWKLVPHADWISVDPVTGQRTEHPESEYAGVYVLTIAMYRDTEPSKLTTATPPKRLEQLTDPVVVQIRDKKVRK